MPIDLAQDSADVTVSTSAQVVEVATAETTVTVHTDDQHVDVRVNEQRVDVAEIGRPGRAGRDGDGSIPAIAFAHGDAPSAVWTPTAAGLLTYARLIIRDVFNGSGASIAVGTAIDPTAVLSPDVVDPALALEFENTPDIHLSAGESIHLTIAPGAGGTQGSGLLLLEFLPD